MRYESATYKRCGGMGKRTQNERKEITGAASAELRRSPTSAELKQIPETGLEAAAPTFAWLMQDRKCNRAWVESRAGAIQS